MIKALNLNLRHCAILELLTTRRTKSCWPCARAVKDAAGAGTDIVPAAPNRRHSWRGFREKQKGKYRVRNDISLKYLESKLFFSFSSIISHNPSSLQVCTVKLLLSNNLLKHSKRCVTVRGVSCRLDEEHIKAKSRKLRRDVVKTRDGFLEYVTFLELMNQS